MKTVLKMRKFIFKLGVKGHLQEADFLNENFTASALPPAPHTKSVKCNYIITLSS